MLHQGSWKSINTLFFNQSHQTDNSYIRLMYAEVPRLARSVERCHEYLRCLHI